MKPSSCERTLLFPGAPFIKAGYCWCARSGVFWEAAIIQFVMNRRDIIFQGVKPTEIHNPPIYHLALPFES